MDGLDCGRCEAEQPVLFDMTVRPEIDSGLPWVVRTGVDPYADRRLSSRIRCEFPCQWRAPMRVTYGGIHDRPGTERRQTPRTTSRLTQRLSGALVRVFALLDNHGQIVPQPGEMTPCVSVPSSAPGTCLQSLLQVAEARTGSEGDFLLLLPPDLE